MSARFPTLETDPYGEPMRLDRCHTGRPLTRVPAELATEKLAPEARTLLDDLAARPRVAVEHGTTETIICYRGYRVGGFDRENGHWFVSQTLATYLVDHFLRQLGFARRTRRFADKDHPWYELDQTRVDAFRHTIEELIAAIDRQVGPPEGPAGSA